MEGDDELEKLPAFLLRGQQGQAELFLDLKELQEISVGLDTTSPKSVCMYVCVHRFVHECLLERKSTPSKNQRHLPRSHFV